MTVNVLMSTYNGERYLHQQIESILRQEDVEVVLTVRDDGSTDKTRAILDEYSAQGLLTWYSGKNLGPARSFLQLLHDAAPADFYAFADQDDVWKPEKLRMAVEQIKEFHGVPAMYFGQTCLTDEFLSPLPEQIPISPLLTYGESLVYQFVGGCTMVLNNSLRDKVVKYTPRHLYMHDVWIYCVCLAVGGRVVFDPHSYIYYRQHGHNVIGQGDKVTEWKRSFHRLITKEQARFKTAQELLQGYSEDMTAENRRLTEDFVRAKNGFLTRLRLMYDKRLATSSPATTRKFRLALLFNTF
ncbi:MAG: glycosyltransferase family 2 protein [Bacteroidaceae bacterium]|nr:glycosyltransferase family 2 protein [Bacteroidaceae bacterium]